MKSLILIRHGEAEHHTQGLTGGWTDARLTEAGEQQLTALAARLRHELAGKPLTLYASDLIRAARSAEIIGQALNTPVITDFRLREMNNGTAANKTEAAAKLLALPRTQPSIDWQHYPAGETRRTFYQRIAACMNDLTHNQSDLTLIVAHRGTILNILYWWLHLDISMAAELGISFDITPASLTVLRVNKWQEHAIERLNDTSHLFAGSTSSHLLFDEG